MTEHLYEDSELRRENAAIDSNVAFLFEAMLEDLISINRAFRNEIIPAVMRYTSQASRASNSVQPLAARLRGTIETVHTACNGGGLGVEPIHGVLSEQHPRLWSPLMVPELAVDMSDKPINTLMLEHTYDCSDTGPKLPRLSCVENFRD